MGVFNMDVVSVRADDPRVSELHAAAWFMPVVNKPSPLNMDRAGVSSMNY